MTKLLFRIVVAIPIVATLLMWLIIGSDRTGWPEPALQYLAWYRSSELSAIEFWASRIGMLGIFGTLISSIGVFLFWSPARFVYAAAVSITLCMELHPTTPFLVGTPDAFFGDLVSICLGLVLALMFTQPCSGWFRRDRKA